MKKVVFILLGFSALFILSCKKGSAVSATPAVSIIGKWYVTDHIETHYFQNTLVDSNNYKQFTTDDYIQYFTDGSGIGSVNATPAPRLSIFKYTIDGTALMVYNSVGNPGVPQTVTKLTATELAIHFVQLVSDPYTGNQDVETNDFTFKK
jgi:hypothetical protein